MKFINTFEEACEAKKLNPLTVIPDFSCYPEKHRKAMVAHAKLVIIGEASNEDWVPDWANYEQPKFYPWFDYTAETSAGSGFAFDGYVDWHSRSIVGSRLCFQSRELAEHIGKTFEHLYKDYFVIE